MIMAYQFESGRKVEYNTCFYCLYGIKALHQRDLKK